jgi:hypothetical protein
MTRRPDVEVNAPPPSSGRKYLGGSRAPRDGGQSPPPTSPPARPPKGHAPRTARAMTETATPVPTRPR